MSLLTRAVSGAVVLLSLLPPALVSAEPEASGEARKVNVEFRGKLKDALREIASEGGFNLIITGELNQPAEIYLTDASAEEALASVASAYHLKVHRQGTIWTLRPMTPEEIAAASPKAVAGPELAREFLAETEKYRAEGRRQIDEAVKSALDEALPGSAQAPKPSAEPSAPASAAAPGTVPQEDLVPASPAPPASPEPDAEVAKQLARKFKHVSKRASTGSVVVDEGEVVESAVAFGGSVTVKRGAIVEDDAVAFGGDVILEEGAVVEGDVVSFGGQIQKHEGAIIEGEQVSMGGGGLGLGAAKHLKEHRKDPSDDDDEDEGFRVNRKSVGGVPGFFLQFALLFGLGFLFNMFVPGRMRSIEGELKRQPVKCGLTGLVGSILLVPLTIVLAVTIVGIPFLAVLWVFVGLGIAMGMAALASQVGLRLPVFKHRKTQAVVLALGVLALLAASRVPVLGALLMVAVMLVAFGAIIRTRFGQTPKGVPEPDQTPGP